jgi:hypothetical protein
LLPAAFAAEPAAALTSRRWRRSVLTGDGRNHEDRGHGRRAGQGHQGTHESVVLLHFRVSFD